ncbi:MAG: carbon storage regulator [Phycisphaeraceae bacterium]|nr:MAG: carbon storage regulator [Phycisphaeraceae bacterium]
MLVITRREGEEVVIGDPNNPVGIVRVASIHADRVRLAFEFARDCAVTASGVAERQRDKGAPPSPSKGSQTTLVMPRRVGEEVVVGDPRKPLGIVRVESIKVDRVRIAFDFPRQVGIHRREIADQLVAPGDASIPVGRVRPSDDEFGELVEPEIMQRALHIHIEPGDADEKLVAELLIALSDMHRAMGGLGLEFRRQPAVALVASEMPV